MMLNNSFDLVGVPGFHSAGDEMRLGVCVYLQFG